MERQPVATAVGSPGGEDLMALITLRDTSFHRYPSHFRAGPVQQDISQ